MKTQKKKKSSNSTLITFIILCIALVGIAGAVVYTTYSDKILMFFESSKISGGTDDSEVVEISEKLFVSWFNEIAADPEKYLGKTVRLEGMFSAVTDGGKTYYNVYRNYAGSCPLCSASTLGFEFTTDNGKMPEENDWIEVTGTLERYEEGGQYYYTLSHATYIIKQERGLEMVLN